jgi:hypothetical protein
MGYGDMFSGGKYIIMKGKHVTDEQELSVNNKIGQWLKDCPAKITSLKINWNEGGLDNLNYIGVNCVFEKEIN